MNVVVDFFRDTLSGWPYFFNLIICLILILAMMGILGDKKKNETMKQLREQRKKELEEGIADKKAAMEGKQIISVETAPVVTTNVNPEVPIEVSEANQAPQAAPQANVPMPSAEVAPTVLVLGSEDNK